MVLAPCNTWCSRDAGAPDAAAPAGASARNEAAKALAPLMTDIPSRLQALELFEMHVGVVAVMSGQGRQALLH